MSSRVRISRVAKIQAIALGVLAAMCLLAGQARADIETTMEGTGNASWQGRVDLEDIDVDVSGTGGQPVQPGYNPGIGYVSQQQVLDRFGQWTGEYVYVIEDTWIEFQMATVGAKIVPGDVVDLNVPGTAATDYTSSGPGQGDWHCVTDPSKIRCNPILRIRPREITESGFAVSLQTESKAPLKFLHVTLYSNGRVAESSSAQLPDSR